VKANHGLRFALGEITRFLIQVFQASFCYSFLEFSVTSNLCGDFCGKGTMKEIFILKDANKKKPSSVDCFSVSVMSVCKVKLFKSVSFSGVEKGLFSSPADEGSRVSSICRSRICLQLRSTLARAANPCPGMERFTRGQHNITFYYNKSRSSPCQLSTTCCWFCSYGCKKVSLSS